MEPSPSNANSSELQRKILFYAQLARTWLDQTTPYPVHRWIATFVLFLVYFMRIFLLQGWYIVTYALGNSHRSGIYLLNLFLAFLQPKFDPSLENDDLSNEADAKDGPSLPTRQAEEFRPFIRKLPEFKFWATRAVLTATFCTFFQLFDIPVFWPILVVYFIILVTLTMKRQIRHMIKYKYVPFEIGKRKYSTK